MVEPRRDLGVAHARCAKRASDVRGCRVARHIGSLGVSAVDLLEGCPCGLDVHLVMRQEQRSVDIEEHEKGQGTTESIASRNERT